MSKTFIVYHKNDPVEDLCSTLICCGHHLQSNADIALAHYRSVLAAKEKVALELAMANQLIKCLEEALVEVKKKYDSSYGGQLESLIEQLQSSESERNMLLDALEPFAKIVEDHNQCQSTTTNTMFSANAIYFLIALKAWEKCKP